MRTTIGLLGALVVIGICSSAGAQFIAPMRYNEGPGLKLSDNLVFHPGLAVEGRYDSNVFYQDGDGTNTIKDAPFMRFIGHIDLATLPPQRLAGAEPKISFRLKSAVGIREYISDNEQIKSQRGVDVDLGMNFVAFPKSLFSLEVNDDFVRTVTARNYEGDARFTRDDNNARALLKFSPGGGRLEVSAGYYNKLDRFEDADMAYLNVLNQGILFKTKWLLLPKTAFTLDFEQGFVDYFDRNQAGAPFVHANSKPMTALIGLVGLITSRLSTTAKIGYTNGFYEEVASTNNANYSTVTGRLDLTFAINPFAKLTGGYMYEVHDSIVATYFKDHVLHLGYDHLIGGRVLAHLAGEYRARSYDGFHQTSSITDWSTNLASANVAVDYQIQDWVYVGLGYDLLLSDPSITRAAGTADTYLGYKYVKHQFFGKVGVSY